MQRLNPSTFCLLTFQSSPNLLGWVQSDFSRFSILTQPIGRARQLLVVSIFTQPLGWMHLGYGSLSTAVAHSVFSILAQPLGWVQRLTCVLWGLVSILAQPIGWGAAGTLSLVWTKGVVVSILIQPLGWARVAVTIALLCFNPHPIFSAGRRFVDVSILT